MDLDRRGFLGLAVGVFSGAGARARASEAPGDAGARALRVHRQTRNTLTSALRRLWPSGPAPRRAKPYAGRPRVDARPPGGKAAPLARVARSFAPAEALGPEALSRDALARLLHLANGVTRVRPGTFPLRAAPSAGALYAGEVYVVAQRVDGLDPGVYSYHVARRELVRLAEGDRAQAVGRAVEHPDAIARAPAFVLLTNVFFRYAHRYGGRGYRYALIDTGHIGENLRLAAAEADLGVCSPLRFQDAALDALLGIDGREEAVCALHAIGAPVAAGAEGAPRARRLVEAGVAGPGLRPTEAYHAATRLVPSAESPAMASAPPAASERPAATGVRALPTRDDPEASVSGTIEQRRSAETFLDADVPLADLAFVLDLARGNARARLAPGIELRLVAHRVAGLPPGLHRHVPDRGLETLRTGDLRDAMHAACLRQDKAASAAVGVAMVADLERAARAGDRCYRDLLIEAGAVAQRIYLAAEAVGLAARNLAAFYDDDLNALLGADGTSEAVVHLTMVGAGD